MTKTVVIGLDGSNWPLIDDWIAAGDLPNFATMKEAGAHGVSRSYLPPVTCPNWKCYASGKNPGKLGVYWWERIDTESRSMALPDSTSFQSPEIWDYLNDAGYTAGVINLPMSYPPREIDRFMIAGGPRSREKNYTYPEELEDSVREQFGYQVHPESVLTSNDNADEKVELIYDLLRTRLRTARTLMSEYDLDFLHLTLFHLNVLQHYFWNAGETKRAYEIIDEELGAFLEEDVNLVLLSDHGCIEIDTVFYINRWLEENGYLVTESSLASYFHRFGITQERIGGIFSSLGLERYVRPLIPRRIIERFPSDDGVVREAKLDMVDWDNTTAIASGQGLVYVVAYDESERESILAALEEDLRSATGSNGKPMVNSVHRPSEIYTGEYLDYAPDLIFDQRPGVHTSEAMGKSEPFAEPTGWRAENIPEGMVLFYGDDVRSTDIGSVRISDVAPTVLHWMGQAVPTDMDGTPLLSVFEGALADGYETRPPLPPLDESDDDRDDLDEDVQDRLEDIGYLE